MWYLFVSRHQNAGRNHNTNISNKPYQHVAKLKYLETTLAYKIRP